MANTMTPEQQIAAAKQQMAEAKQQIAEAKASFTANFKKLAGLFGTIAVELPKTQVKFIPTEELVAAVDGVVGHFTKEEVKTTVEEASVTVSVPMAYEAAKKVVVDAKDAVVDLVKGDDAEIEKSAAKAVAQFSRNLDAMNVRIQSDIAKKVAARYAQYRQAAN